MKYGLIGEKLGHSFSPEIHGMLADYSYELKELSPSEFDSFIKSGKFDGINVTIPYKKTVMDHLYYIDTSAYEIGAVNTVLNTEGHLFGFNTDFDGMVAMIRRAGISLEGRSVAILGTGGTSCTAAVVSKKLGAREIIKVSRNKSQETVSYDELYEKWGDVEILINTTPVGMYPDCENTPVDLSRLTRLEGVVDVIYNPIRTPLVSEATKRGIPATGGMYMLVAQAVRASEIFTGEKYAEEITESVYEKIIKDKENIVLIGMPSSGKSTVGKLLADELGFSFTDTDDEIVKREGTDIPTIFRLKGEEYFRDLEEEVIKDVSRESRRVIATGGGSVLKSSNIERLRRNGRIIFLDRPLDMLMPTLDRPLSSDRDHLLSLYEKRYPIYSSVCDLAVDASGAPESISLEIKRRIK